MGSWSMQMLFLFLLCFASVSSSVALSSLAVPPLVPAFVWSNSREGIGHGDEVIRRRVSYQTLSTDDLAGALKDELERADESQREEIEGRPVDVVVAFFGSKLRSVDVPREDGLTSTSDLVQVLSAAVMSSNSSFSMPYVAPPRDGGSLSETLLRAVVRADLDGDGSRVGQVMTIGSCVYKNDRANRFSNLDSVKQFLSVRKENKLILEIDLLVVCNNGNALNFLQEPKPVSEGEILDELLWTLDESKARYVALYATDLPVQRLSPKRSLSGRQLSSVKNEEDEFCDEVCKTKASILEGLFVAVTLLLILLSGICCMAGIASPTRFEQSKDGQ